MGLAWGSGFMGVRVRDLGLRVQGLFCLCVCRVRFENVFCFFHVVAYVEFSESE